MITVYPFDTLGHANHGWLNAHHHFSFSRYHNPQRLEFGVLRVINDDTVAAGRGFSTHPHDNMEIITYVRKGAITHKDSLGNEGRTNAGDVQVMSAGSGVFHSEVNMEKEETQLYQIWITPREHNVQPRWEASAFPKEPVTDALKLLVSGFDEDKNTPALFIHQNAAIYGGRMTAGTTFTHIIRNQAYVLASKGQFKINESVLEQGDGAEIVNEKTVSITALTDAEILLIDVPTH